MKSNKRVSVELPLRYSSAKLSLIKQILVKTTGYFNGDLHRFTLGEDQLLHFTPYEPSTAVNKIKSDFSPKILIVARKFYQERVFSFPVDNLAELKKLLALEFQQQPRTHYAICKIEDGKSLVNSWCYSDEAPNSTIMIPESLLLTLTANDSQIIHFESESNSLFAVRNQSVIYSQIQTKNINTPQRFSISVGVAVIDDDKLVNQKKLAEHLALGCQKLSLAALFRFVNFPKGEDSKKTLVKALLPVTIVLSVYVLVSSTYLAYKNNSLRSQVSEQSQQVTQALNKQQQYDNNVKEYDELTQFLTSKQVRSPIWLVLSEAFSQVQLTNIRLLNNRYILRGKTQKATDLLELLANHPLVKEARFDTPTRTRKKQELFVISLKLIENLNISNSTVLAPFKEETLDLQPLKGSTSNILVPSSVENKRLAP